MKKIFFTLFVITNLFYFLWVNAFSLDFEQVSYNFKSWNNQSTGPWNDWSRTTSQHYNGSYSLQSWNTNDSTFSCFEIREYFYTNWWIKFHHKESSESNRDFLKFYVNWSYKSRWSGNTSWSEYSYNVNSWWNTFKWCYKKDWSVSSWNNKVWVDNIRFQWVDCNPTWWNWDWRQIYSCRFKYSKKLYRNILLYNATINIYSWINMWINLSNYYIKFLENSDIWTSSIPSKITIPTNSKIDNSTSWRYYESYSYNSTSWMTSCPAWMYALKTDKSNYQWSSSTSVWTSWTLYCWN